MERWQRFICSKTPLQSAADSCPLSGSKFYSDRHIKCICQYIFGHVDTSCLSHSQVDSVPIPCDVKSPHTFTYIHIFDAPKLKTKQFPSKILTLTFDNCRRETSHFKVRLLLNNWTTPEEKERHSSKYAKQLDQMCAQTTVISGEHKIQIWILQFGVAHSRPPSPSSSTSYSFQLRHITANKVIQFSWSNKIIQTGKILPQMPCYLD